MKIKFRALCLAALVVVMAFASVASAATFVGVNGTTGRVQTFTVDISDGGTPISRKSNIAGVNAPTLTNTANPNGVLKMFSVPGKIYVTSVDTLQAGGQVNPHLYVYNVADDGTPTYDKTLEAPSLVAGMQGSGMAAQFTKNLSGVKRVVDFNGTPVFVGESGFAALLNNTNIISLDVSVDLAFVYNDKLYIINSRDMADGMGASYIQEVSAITASTVSQDIADVSTNVPNTGKSGVLSYRVRGEDIEWPANVVGTNDHGPFCSVVTEKFVYMSSSNGVYKIDLSETDVLHSPTIQKTVLQGEFLAMTANGETIYAVKRMGSNYYLVSVATGTDAEDELHRITNDEWTLPTAAAAPSVSMDIYYSASDKVIGVVAHDTGLAVFTPHATLTDKWEFYTSDGDFRTATMAITSGTTPTPDPTPVTTTTVDINTLDSGVASTIASTMGTDASKFVTATVASKTSTTSAAEAAVKTAFGDTNAKVTVLGSYTPSAEGFILVAQSIAHGKKAYFVDESILAADSTGLNEATLLDSKGAVLTSGNSTYVAGGSLDANKAYTLVTAETDTSKEEDTGDTGSSSSGCDAGFGLMSLAALLAVTTISKRR